jgi:large subunit ribosomal protein L18
MKKFVRYSVPYRRKREGKTHYKKRLKLLLANKPRLVIRKSLKNINTQIVEYNPTGDKVVIGVNSCTLSKFGWNTNLGNLPSAYLTGILIGKKAKKMGYNELIPDLGFYRSVKGSRLYACLKGVSDAGINVHCSAKMFPPEKRIKGEHILNYAKMLESDKKKYESQFSRYIQNNTFKLFANFETIKKKILSSD